MSDLKISELEDGVSAQAGDALPIARGGQNYYITAQYLKNFVFGSGGTIAVAAGKAFSVNNTITLNGTDGVSIDFGSGGTFAYVSNGLGQFASTTSAQLRSVISDETGTGSLVFSDTPTLTSPILGTPQSGTLTNCGGLPIAGVTGWGTDVDTWVVTPSSANLRAAMTDETGTGSLVFATSPTLVTPILGTPQSGNFSTGTFTWPTFNQNTTGNAANVTGIVVVANGGTGLSSGTSGGVPYYSATGTIASSAALAANALVIGGGAGVAPSTTTTGSGILTFLGTPSSANLAAAVTDETGTGALVFANSPTFTSQVTLGTQSTTRGTLVLANTTAGSKAVTLQSSNSTTAAYAYTLTLPAAAPVNGYYLQTDASGVLSWAAGGGGGGGSPGGSTTQVQYNNAGTFGGMPGFTFDGTATVSLGVASTTSGSLKLYNSASANSVSIASGNNTASWTLTLPPDDGSANQFLQTDGSGNTIWAAAAAGTINTGTVGQITYYSGTNTLSGTTTGTGVLTALGNNTNVAGGVLVPAAALTANALVIGGGSGTGPSTTTTGTGILTFLGTPTSANLAAAVTDETGTGSLVFSNSPTFNDDITLGVASTATGIVNFKGTTSGTVSLSVYDAAGTWTMKLPTSGGTNGYVLTTDGSGNTSWAAAASAVTAASDTTTATALYPLFAAAASGTLSTIYTSNPKYNYTPSTGILSAVAVSSTNGISLNAMTIAADFTVPTNYNGGSFGPVTIDSGITVTVSSGSTYTVV